MLEDGGGWGGGGGGGGGSLRDLSKNILKQGVGKGRNLFVGGDNIEGDTIPLPGKF